MNKVLQALSGLCLASVRQGRFGLREVGRASVAAYFAARNTAPFKAQPLEEQPLPTIELEQILGERAVEIVLDVKNGDDGSLPFRQALDLLSIVAATNPKIVLEIGTFMGHTTKAIARTLPNAIIHTVDLPLDFVQEADPVADLKKDDFHLIKGRTVGREFRGTEYEKRIRQHFVDTAKWNFSDAAGASLFFVDGAHTYDYCKNDSDKCYQLCGGKGIFLWHDCDTDHPGVVKCLNEWRAMGRNVVRIATSPIGYWDGSMI